MQDRITLVNEKLWLVLGTKLEHNSYTGFEYQPSARIIWTPNNRSTVWASVTRAVRTPTRFDRDIDLTWTVTPAGMFPLRIAALGDHDFESEKVISYELGYRIQPKKDLYFDTALFVNFYDDIRTYEPEAIRMVMNPVPYMLLPYRTDNMMKGETYGFEFLANWEVAEKWRLKAAYTFLQMQLHPGSASSSTMDTTWEGRSPHNQFYLGSYFDLRDNLELDIFAKYVDSLPSIGIPSYIRLDARLGWHISKNLEASFVVQNLLDKKHPEFSSSGITTTENQRAFYAKLTWRF